MVELLPAAGMAAYLLVLPIAGVILLILALVTGSYRQVVMTYTQRGGSYVVARSNFGPRIAQISSAALLIDYVVTVAVQCASGTFAVVSAVPSLGPYHLEITVGALLLMSYANLRGIAGIWPDLRHTGVLVHHHARGDDCDRSHPSNLLGLTAIRSRAHRRGGAGPSGQRADHGSDGAGVVAGVRQRGHLADRRRGDRRRGERLSKAARAQRPSRVDQDGLHSGIPAGRCHLSGTRHPRHPLRRRVSLDAFRGRPCGLRPRLDRRGHVRPSSDGERGNFVFRRQHQLQRVSGTDQFCCRGQFLAAADDETWSPPCVFQRHHHSDRAGGDIGDSHRRLGRRGGTAVCDGGLHRILDGRLRDDQIQPGSS